MKRDDLVAALTLKPVPVEMPGIGSIHVRPWTMAERTAFALWRKDHEGSEGLAEFLFALSVCDETGVRVFDTSSADLAAVAGLSGVAVQEVAERVVELNGIGVNAGKA